MNSTGSRIISLGSDKADEEQGTSMSAATAPEGDNRDMEGVAIKIISALQTHPSILALIETKKAVLSHVIVVVIDLLLLLLLINSP